MSTSQVDKGRVISFRAWNKKRKRMYEVLHLHLDASGVWATLKGFDVIDDKHIHLQIQPEGIELMQSTGLTDKNGKEIYEGDIISNGQHVCYVVFIDGCFWLKRDGCTTTNLMYSWPNNCYPMFRVNHVSYSEVIGNLHQDKHLLK